MDKTHIINLINLTIKDTCPFFFFQQINVINILLITNIKQNQVIMNSCTFIFTYILNNLS
jgi:hypothetical protein